MNYETVFNQVVILCIMLFIGYYAARRGFLDKEMNKKLSDLLLNITLPCLVVTSFQMEFSRTILQDAALICVASFASILASALLARLMYRKYPWQTYTILSFITIFSNSAFMGYPVMDSLYPGIGVLYTSMYVVVFNLVMWSYGLALFTGHRDMTAIRQAVLNPGILSTGLGLLLFVFSVKLPFPVFKALASVGAMTTPLSMLIIGALLCGVHFRELVSGKHLTLTIAMRLLILPLLTFLGFYALGLRGQAVNVVVLVTAMPGAAITVIFAEKFGADSLLASKLVALSTLASLITLPGLILFLARFS